MAKVSMSYRYSFSRYKTKRVMKFLFRQLMTSESLIYTLDQDLKQWLTGRKIGEHRNTKNWISRERKEFFRWNKKYISYVLKDCHLVKNNFLKKIAETALRYKVSIGFHGFILIVSNLLDSNVFHCIITKSGIFPWWCVGACF